MEEERTSADTSERKESKGNHRRLDAAVWAGVLIWAAFVILMEGTGLVAGITWWSAWPVFFVGFGIIILLAAAAGLLMPERRGSAAGGLILGFILLGIGLSSLFGWNWGWALVLPAILIVVAVSVLVRAFASER